MSRPMRIGCAMLALLLACGCSSTRGPSGSVLRPEGDEVLVTLASALQQRGELVMVTDSDVALLQAAALVQIPWPTISKVQAIDFKLMFKRKDIEKLKLHSRYPHGLSEAQWSELLRHYGQSSPEPPLEAP